MPAPSQSQRRWLGGLLLLLALALGSWVRIDTALSDPNFDRTQSEGMLKSDPALVYYFVERILEAGGGVPDDFRADPRVRHPVTTDIPALFPVAQEFVVAWTYRWFGEGVPLHVFCVIVMGLWASLGAVGVFGLARELSGSQVWAGVAALGFALLPANYRTIGFILVREDFSLPWFLLHLYLALRALRLRSPGAVLLAAVTLAAALATWHAMRFFATLEAVVLLAWFLRSGQNPFSQRVSWILPVVLAGFAWLVPVLRHTGMAFSLPMQALAGLAVAALWRRWKPDSGRPSTVLVALGGVALWFGLALWSSGEEAGMREYSHVFGLMAAKLKHLGQLPLDPSELPFEVRLMWQGPFDTLQLAHWREVSIYAVLAAVLWLVLRSLRSWLPIPQGSPAAPLTLALATLSVPLAWLIARTIVLPAALAPALFVWALSRSRRGPWLAALALGLQGLLFSGFVASHVTRWYLPPVRQKELAMLVETLGQHVPSGEPVAADFMNSTALLAQRGHPIVMQPKYEDRLSRERAQAFFHTFYEGTLEELRALVEQEFGCRYLLIDRHTLWFLGRYTGGLPWSATAPRAGSAAATLLSQEDEKLTTIQGWELLYRSPSSGSAARQKSGDFFRLYRFETER